MKFKVTIDKKSVNKALVGFQNGKHMLSAGEIVETPITLEFR